MSFGGTLFDPVQGGGAGGRRGQKKKKDSNHLGENLLKMQILSANLLETLIQWTK